MREILFRGKRIDNGEWVEIEIFKGRKGFEEWTDGLGPVTSFVDTSTGNSKKWCRANVDPETIGQYTGIKDINKIKIFDGDILKVSDMWGNSNKIIEVFWHEYSQGWGSRNYDIDDSFPEEIKAKGYVCSGLMVFSNYEVIGNAHDNPELLVVQG